MGKGQSKKDFQEKLSEFADSLNDYVSGDDGQWTVKGFIDIYKNVYTISSDTKIVSKILEIHIFPKILRFAEGNGYKLVLADHQNYYPDISFVSKSDESIKYAVDFKSTYRDHDYPGFCNGFTLGSHGKYFINRASKKNIQFPYSEYNGHFCLGIIYTRVDGSTIDETKSYQLDALTSIASVVKDFQFFAVEKWKIASDCSGSGNTANIGSINNIDDIINGRGMFSQLGEDVFDDYWMNYGRISVAIGRGKTKKITKLADFVEYRKYDASKIVARPRKTKKK